MHQREPVIGPFFFSLSLAQSGNVVLPGIFTLLLVFCTMPVRHSANILCNKNQYKTTVMFSGLHPDIVKIHKQGVTWDVFLVRCVYFTCRFRKGPMKVL